MTDITHKKIKIGISGKRSLLSPDEVKQDIADAIRAILDKENTGHFVGFTALAKGSDTLFAEVVESVFNQEVRIALPFSSDEYKKDFAETADLEAYEGWVKKTGISKVVTEGDPRTPEQQDEAYFSVGKYLVDECDYMIFVWDGLKPAGRGGTAEILGYASQLGKPFELVRVDPVRTDEIDNKIRSLLKASDGDAIRLKREHERIWGACLLFGWLAALCLDATLSFHFEIFGKLLFAGIELGLILIVFFLIRRFKKKQLHPNFLKERVRAEKLRLLITYYHADMPITISGITQQDDEELASIGNSVKNESVGKAYRSELYKYFAIKSLIQEQINYHKPRASTVVGKILEHTKTGIYVVWFLILVSHFVALLFHYFEWHSVPILSYYPYPEEISRFLIIGLPATNAAIEGFLFFKEWENFKEQSRLISEVLSKERSQLEQSQLDNDKMLAILNNVSIAMLAENQDWQSVLSKKGAPNLAL